MKVTGVPDCFDPVRDNTSVCKNISWCWKVFGDKLGCDQNPKKKNEITVAVVSYRRLELL